MESCSRRRHSPRCRCSKQKKHKSRHTFTAETSKKPGGQTHQNRDRPTWVLRSGSQTLDLKHLQDVGSRKNNRAECSHVPIRRRERKSQKFRSVHQAQKLLSTHAQIYNLFNHRRHLISRNTLRKFRQQAQNEWNIITATACA